MAIRQLPHADWNDYFDAFSKAKDDADRVDYAEIRVFSPEIGVKPQAKWLPLQGLTYDRNDDRLEVLVVGLDHMMVNPKAIFVEETSGRLDSIEIVRENGTYEVVEFL
jgi:hypothetical protein